MSTRFGRCFGMSTITIDSANQHYDNCGGRTRFDQWAECPLSTEPIREKNRKRYPNVKSRYAEPSRRSIEKKHRGHPTELSVEQCWMIKRERDKLASYDTIRSKRMAVLSPAERMYLDMIEVGGRLDKLASALGHLFAVDTERVAQRKWFTTIPSIQIDDRLLDTMKNALFARDDDNLPSALLRMAFAFTAEEHCLWAIELCLMTALSLLADGGGRDEASCLYVTGQFYAATEAEAMHTHCRMVSRSARFLERARRAADGHRQNWRLSPDIQNAAWVRATADGDVWNSACLAEYAVLLDAANAQEPKRALRVVQAASRLLKLCDVAGHERRVAATEYELGVKYVAVGQLELAAESFGRCAEIASAMGADLGSDLDLEARLEMARTFKEPLNDMVLKWVVEEALKRRNGQLMAKALSARGRLNAYNNTLKRAFRHFSLAYRLAVPIEIIDVNEYEGDDNVGSSITKHIKKFPQKITVRHTAIAVLQNKDNENTDTIVTSYVDEEDVDTARMYAAVSRTCLYMQTNYYLLRYRKFNLLDSRTRWSGNQVALIIRDGADGSMYLNPDRFQDACVNAEAREICRKLYGDDDGTDHVVEEDSANKFEDDLPKKKRVTIYVD